MLKRLFLSTVMWLVVGGWLNGSLEAADEVPTLRFGFRAVFQAQDLPVSPTFSLISKRVPGRPPHIGFQYKLFDETNHLFQHGFLQLGTEKQIDLADCSTRCCLLEVEFGHAALVQSRTPFCFLASKAFPLRLQATRFAGKLYFYVPKNCRQFEIGADCGPNRVQPMEIEDAQGGNRTVTREVRAGPQYWKVAVPPGSTGGVWSAKTSSSYDLRLQLEGDLPPLFALKPEWAASIGPRMTDNPDAVGTP